MELTQILLFSVVVVLTCLLVFLGVQVFFILREARRTMEKINKLLDGANLVSDSVARPIASFANFVDGVKNFGNLMDMILNKKEVTLERGYNPEEIEEHEKGHHSHIRALQERGRRFFHKDGKPLTS